MHNFIVSATPSAIQQATNMSVLESACSSDMYSHWLSAEMLSEGGHASAAIYTAATLSSPSYWALADGVTSGVGAYIRRHHEWKSGAFKLKVHWASDATGGAVRTGADIAPVSEETTLPAFAVTKVATVDAPAVADTIVVTELSSSALSLRSAISREHCGLVIGFRRAGGHGDDTNTGTVKVFGIELIYTESRHNVGDLPIR